MYSSATISSPETIFSRACDGAVVVEHKLLDGLLESDVAAARLDVVHHGRAQAVGLVTVEERHLETVVSLRKRFMAVRTTVMESLSGSMKSSALAMEMNTSSLMRSGMPYLRMKSRTESSSCASMKSWPSMSIGMQRRRRLQLLAEAEHLLVEEDGETEVERRGDARDEVEGGELAGELLHGEDHLVHLPLEAVLDVELREEVHHVRVRAEEDVQAGLDPVAVLVLPRGHLTAERRAPRARWARDRRR